MTDEHERARRRAPLRVAAIGVPLSFALAVVSGLVGLPGAVGGAVFISLLSLTSAVAGVVVGVGVVVDQYRGRDVPIARVLLTGGLLLATLALLIASAGATLAAARGGP